MQQSRSSDSKETTVCRDSLSQIQFGKFKRTARPKIDELQANIERGENWQASERVLRAILRGNPGYHFVQTEEEERSMQLQLMKNMPEFTVQDKVNLEDVVRAYEDGSLQCPAAGKGVLYFGGEGETPNAVDMIDYPVVEKADVLIVHERRDTTHLDRAVSSSTETSADILLDREIEALIVALGF
ncbi:hypothetical protein Q9L58_008315 [Maublancomyces gigas]|uniref:Uncharacterized protein n=1 Tax=Discina gigas TaxID=1032678 RepID=A0ABR3GA13_9PEZI